MKIKQSTTYEQQIEILKSHGCIITDEQATIKILSDISYYRLTAYGLPFKNSDGNYKDGTTFEQIYRLYEFDRKLRNLLFGVIETIEISLRSKLSYFHADKYGAIGYLNTENFNNKHDEIKFKSNIEREIENNKNVQFVKHHLEKYDGQFPLWVLSEVFTFGMLSYFYNDLKTADKKIIAGKNFNDMVSWLRCCTDLRNICAHYGRLYYRVFSAVPNGFDLQKREERRLWGAVLAIKALYPDKEKWNNEFLPSMIALFDEYSEYINLYHIGFPIDWTDKLNK